MGFGSAGTHGWDAKPMDAVMSGALGDGVECGSFPSRPLTRELIDEADLVLIAEASHRSYVLEDHPAAFRKVFTLGQAVEVRGLGGGAQ